MEVLSYGEISTGIDVDVIGYLENSWVKNEIRFGGVVVNYSYKCRDL